MTNEPRAIVTQVVLMTVKPFGCALRTTARTVFL